MQLVNLIANIWDCEKVVVLLLHSHHLKICSKYSNLYIYQSEMIDF